jgi:hypothetical protein
MKHALKTALVVAAITAVAGPAFAGIIVHDAAPIPPSFVDLLLALLRP